MEMGLHQFASYHYLSIVWVASFLLLGSANHFKIVPEEKLMIAFCAQPKLYDTESFICQNPAVRKKSMEQDF